MRVALFGGTGFVGSYLVEALIAAGHMPSLLVRDSSEKKVRCSGQCRLVRGELHSDSMIDTTLEDCDAVIYNIGILREFAGRGITFEELQYNGVVRVAAAAKRRGISRVLLMSANGVKRPGTVYQETKLRAEQHLQDGGFELTVFRPSVIFGDPRGTMEIASQLHRDMIAPPLPAVGFFCGLSPARGEILLSPVHVADVALAFAAALDDPATIGHTYALGGPEVLSWTTMLRRIASAAGRAKWILPMPLDLMRFAAGLFDRLSWFPVTRDQLTMLAEGNIVDPAELEALIQKAPMAFVPENLAYLGR